MKKTKKKRRPMRKGGGAAKGGAFERKIARSLSTWWYGEEGYLWRRPGSGFRARQPMRHTGDIVPVADVPLPDPWPFHIEAKCWAKKRLKLDMLLWPTKNPIRRIWVKAVNERRKDLVPMLILKANLVDPVAVMRETDADRLVNCLMQRLIADASTPYLDSYVRVNYKMKQPIIMFSLKFLQDLPRPKGAKL